MRFCSFDSGALSLPVNCGSCDWFASEFEIRSDSDIGFHLKSHMWYGNQWKIGYQVVFRKSLYTENHS